MVCTQRQQLQEMSEQLERIEKRQLLQAQILRALAAEVDTIDEDVVDDYMLSGEN